MAEQQKKQKPLAVSNFKVDNVAFEVRYDNAYLLWDRAGHVWWELLKTFPSLEMAEAQPALTAFTLDDYTSFNVHLDKSFVVSKVSDYPFKDVLKYADALVATITSQLKIEMFTRAGFRVTHAREFPSREDAVEVLLGSGIFSPPAGTMFGVSKARVSPDFNIRWEGENSGTLVRVKVESRKLESKSPPGFEEFESKTVEKFVLVLDFDYYNTGTISVGQFRASDWINSASHLIRKDFDKFLRGE